MLFPGRACSSLSRKHRPGGGGVESAESLPSRSGRVSGLWPPPSGLGKRGAFYRSMEVGIDGIDIDLYP